MTKVLLIEASGMTFRCDPVSQAIKSQWRALHHVKGRDLNFKLDRAGAGMNVDMGGLELNLFVIDCDEQQLETVFFLGFDSHW